MRKTYKIDRSQNGRSNKDIQSVSQFSDGSEHSVRYRYRKKREWVELVLRGPALSPAWEP